MKTAGAIRDAVLAQVREAGLNVFDMAVYCDGEWARGVVNTAAPCQNSYSVTKSFTCTAVGLAVEDGNLSPDDRVLDFFRDELPPDVDPRMEELTVRHLMTNMTGLEQGFLFEADRHTHGTGDWLFLCLSRPLARRPGTVYTYSNSNFYLLSRIVHKAAGTTIDRLLQSRLFNPMEVRDNAWAVCPRGYPQGGTGLYMSAQDLAKAGVLYMNGGEWEGRRLLSEAWCREASGNRTGLEEPRYGYGIWIYPDGFEFNGAHGQIVLVRPGDRLVLAAHAHAADVPYRAMLERALE